MPRRILQGVVVSDKADKTVVVRVERRLMHPLYKKFITRSKRFAAHDAENRCRVGDKVRIQECPPVSKSKAYMVLYDETIGKGRTASDTSPDDIANDALETIPGAKGPEKAREEAPGTDGKAAVDTATDGKETGGKETDGKETGGKETGDKAAGAAGTAPAAAGDGDAPAAAEEPATAAKKPAKAAAKKPAKAATKKPAKAAAKKPAKAAAKKPAKAAAKKPAKAAAKKPAKAAKKGAAKTAAKK